MRVGSAAGARLSRSAARRAKRFRYLSYDYDAGATLTCRYSLDDSVFEERVMFERDDSVSASSQAVDQAAWLVFLLAGVSYYKAGAPGIIEVGGRGLTPGERQLLEALLVDGLGEFALENRIDLSAVEIVAPDRLADGGASAPAGLHGPLIPFGGGIDSIVTVEGLRAAAADAAIFVVSQQGVRFEAIERPARVTGLPIVRAERQLDDKVLRSTELGYLNGHVPVTGILSAIGVMAAVLAGRDSVVMSNEWSASSGNVLHDGRMVNHQWSKSVEFEDLFRRVLAESGGLPDYFSWLRPFSEVWVAERFAALTHYHGVFRSCNRAFFIDPAERLDRWCGRCDKCCFVDLILSPFLEAGQLQSIFGGREPLRDPALAPQFLTLVGASALAKPFECVGDVSECRGAALLAAARPDRAGDKLLQRLAREAQAGGDDPFTFRHESLLHPLGRHYVPSRYAPSDLLE